VGSLPVLGGVCVAHRLSFLCCVFCIVCLFPKEWFYDRQVCNNRSNTICATSRAGTAYPFRTPEFTPVFSGVRVCSNFSFLYRSLLVLLSFFYWLLYCL